MHTNIPFLLKRVSDFLKSDEFNSDFIYGIGMIKRHPSIEWKFTLVGMDMGFIYSDELKHAPSNMDTSGFRMIGPYWVDTDKRICIFGPYIFDWMPNIKMNFNNEWR